MRVPLIAWALVALVLLICAADASSDTTGVFRLFPSAVPAELREPPSASCHLADVQTYQLSQGSPRDRSRAVLTPSTGLTLESCFTLFRGTVAHTLRPQLPVDAAIAIVCDAPRVVDSDSFQFSLIVAGNESGPAYASTERFLCIADPPHVLRAKLANPTEVWSAGDALGLRIRFIGPTPQPDSEPVYVVAAPDAPPLVETAFGSARSHPDDAGPGSLPADTAGPGPAGWTVAALVGLAAIGFSRRLVRIVLAGFARIAPDRLERHPVRARILDLVAAHPGLGLSELPALLEGSRGAARHHVRMLVAGRLLLEVTDGRSVHLFGVGTPVSARRSYMLGRRPWVARVLEAVASNPGVSVRGLAQILRVQPSTVMRETMMLEASGLLRRERAGLRMRLFTTP